MAAIPLTSANEIRLIQQRIEKGVEAEFGSRLSVTASGYLPLYSRIVDTVVSDQLKSFLIAFGVILGLIFLVLRSARLTLIALPSNFLPVLLVIGAMGLLQLPLDLVSVTLAATILGIIVDDSLHVLYNYKHQLSEGHSIQESTNKVARLTGAAVFGTSLILMLGYGIIALSTVPILATTGRLMELAVFAALISDLLLLPALVRLVYGGRKRDKI
jgi:predicted RND superfamily exporter protein